MDQTINLQGHAPAVRASRALTRIDVRKAYTRTLAFARRKAVTLAVISAAACYTGALFSCDPLTYTAAFVALGFVRLSDSTPEGGDA